MSNMNCSNNDNVNSIHFRVNFPCNRKGPSNKFLKLNFNIKNEIMNFLSIKEIYNDVIYVNSRFLLAFKKNKIFEKFRHDKSKLM